MEIHSTSHLHITADMDEETKTKLRREKNRCGSQCGSVWMAGK
jgi:hypothetical protein